MLRATGDESSQKIAQKIMQLIQIGITDLHKSWRNTLLEHAGQIEPLAFVIKNQPLPVYSREQVAFMSSVAIFAKEESHIEGLQRPLSEDFLEMRSAYMQKSLYTFVLASQRNLEIRTANLYERENNGIGHYTEALVRMSRDERGLAVAVFGEAEGVELHNLVVSAAFSDYSFATKAIIGHVRSRIDTDCYLGFETLENMMKLDRIVKDIEMPEIARELHSNVATLAGISASSFSELLEDVRRKLTNLVVLPADGGVVEATKELCVRLRKFVDYPQIVAQLLLAIGDSGWRRPVAGPIRLPSGDSPQGFKLRDIYAAELIDTLLQVLEQKARALHKRLNVVGIFLLNNASYIQTSIVRSELARYLSDRSIAKIEDFNKRAFRMYRESWDVSARQLMDTTIMRPQDAKAARNSLTSKDRDAVKERFKVFNTEFDESIKACKTFNVTDGDLRQALTSEIRSIIVPLYSRFHDKYVNTDFTKNKEKYIKYSKESIEKAIWDAFT